MESDQEEEADLSVVSVSQAPARARPKETARVVPSQPTLMPRSGMTAPTAQRASTSRAVSSRTAGWTIPKLGMAPRNERSFAVFPSGLPTLNTLIPRNSCALPTNIQLEDPLPPPEGVILDTLDGTETVSRAPFLTELWGYENKTDSESYLFWEEHHLKFSKGERKWYEGLITGHPGPSPQFHVKSGLYAGWAPRPRPCPVDFRLARVKVEDVQWQEEDTVGWAGPNIENVEGKISAELWEEIKHVRATQYSVPVHGKGNGSRGFAMQNPTASHGPRPNMSGWNPRQRADFWQYGTKESFNAVKKHFNFRPYRYFATYNFDNPVGHQGWCWIPPAFIRDGCQRQLSSDNKLLYSCVYPACGYVSRNDGCYLDHVRRDHCWIGLKCSLCGVVFDTLAAYRFHAKLCRGFVTAPSQRAFLSVKGPHGPGGYRSTSTVRDYYGMAVPDKQKILDQHGCNIWPEDVPMGAYKSLASLNRPVKF